MAAVPVRTVFALGAAVILLGLTGGACSLADRSPDAGRSGTTEAPSTPATAPGPTLTTAGAAPRVVLRFRFRPGMTQTVAVTTDVGVTETEPQGPQTVDPPPVVQTLQFRVDSVATDGTARITFRVTKADVGRGNALSETEAAAYRNALQSLVGIRGSGQLSPLGQFEVADLSVPAGVGPSVRSQVDTLRNQVSNLAPVLPSEPVGVGASWTAETTTSLGGATVSQAVSYTVTAVDGDHISYRSTSSATASRQPLALTGLPDGTVASLVSSDLTGTGTGTLDLTSVVSASSTATAGTQVIEVAAGDAPPTSTSQRIMITTRSRPAG